MKLSDYVMAFLHDHGVTDMFYLPGGGCMHLLDSLGSSPIREFSMLHEQAATVAAEAFANTTGRVGAVLATTGPGATNTVTGIVAAYNDSTPVFVLTGQVKTTDMKTRYGVRSMGNQEADIVSIVSSVTKYAATVLDPQDIRMHLERAWHEAVSPRRGPVLIDIPLDVQAADIDPEALQGFIPETASFEPDVSRILEQIAGCSRPCLIAGNGVSQCLPDFKELAWKLGFPVIPTWKACDLIAHDSDFYAGHAGPLGDRPGNLAMQNADLLLCIGARMDFSVTGYDRSQWAPDAVKIVVDIDASELSKLEEVAGITTIHCDCEAFIAAMLDNIGQTQMPDITAWLDCVREWKDAYPISAISPHQEDSALSIYDFVAELSAQLPDDARIVPSSSGVTAEVFYQAFKLKGGQRVIGSHALGSMGFDVPAAIGMCVASGFKPVACVAGDGGIQLNIQELAVIAGKRLPIAIFVMNNKGYASIRNMQDNHFKGRHIGCDEASGLSLPRMQDLAAAYGLDYLCCDSMDSLPKAVAAALAPARPVLCEVIVTESSAVALRTATVVQADGSIVSSPLDGQHPLISRDELMAPFARRFGNR
jgi:acetolactate synthase-1/2/3 large subunit